MTDTDQLLQNLLDRVEALEDTLAITKLLATYGPAVDSGSAEAVARLWTEDGVYDVDTGVLTGQAEISAMVRSRAHQGYIHGGCAHLLEPGHVQLDGLQAVVTCKSQLILHDGDAYRVARITANRWELSKIEGQWKVTRRTNRLLDGRAEARELLARGVQD
ncbi:nuclear transport factor 2 family protein [Rhodococcus sp. H36-A4]|uniref:nuclear transport factor 2 family protein n=1 Tax=Rhodococcus sp. H36-A4 TaxID=3004353 RepID=UPI0022B053DC|nr:nuclear transport factor 2 family protein [Rhodococcus sp. H36-A4]MCZ4076623.1 nuclear transport factor 2 family protein [Rhodococcus sp. H36-A4]